MKISKTILLLLSGLSVTAYPCGNCYHFAMGNIPIEAKLANVPLKAILKGIPMRDEDKESDPVVTWRGATLLNNDECVELLVDVGCSVAISQKFTGFCPLTLFVAAKQTAKVVVREKTLTVLTQATNKAQQATGVNIAAYLGGDNQIAQSLLAGMTKEIVKFGLDYCLNSVEA